MWSCGLSCCDRKYDPPGSAERIRGTDPQGSGDGQMLAGFLGSRTAYLDSILSNTTSSKKAAQTEHVLVSHWSSRKGWIQIHMGRCM